MNNEKLAVWAEVVASIAVVVTLAFLIYEVRQNTVAVERQTYLDRQARLLEPYLESQDFREIYVKIKNRDGLEPRVQHFVDTYALSVEEALYWVRHLDQNWRGFENDFYRYGPNAGLNGMITGFLSFPDGRLYWDSAAQTAGFSDEFVNHVESLRPSD